VSTKSSSYKRAVEGVLIH